MTADKKEEASTLKLSNFASNTTLHGLDKTCEANSHIIRRCIWIVLLLSAIAAYLFVMVTSVIKYYRFDTNTIIVETTVKSLKFPSVSICQQNQFSESFVQQNDPLMRYWMEYLEMHRPNTLTPDEITNATSVLENTLLINAFAGLPPNFLSRCEFDGEPFDCADYATVEQSEMSNCATIMSGTIRDRMGPWKTKRPGFSFGLDVWIDINVNNTFVTSSSGNGVKVLVHNHRNRPRISEQGTGIEPGTEAYIAIRKRKVMNLQPPYSEVDCVSNTAGHRYRYFTGGMTYTFETCMLDCQFRNIEKKCGCGVNTASSACTLADYYFCYRPNTNYFHDCDCLHPCKQTQYETKMTTLALPTPMVLAESRARNDTYTTTEDIVKNMINLKVFFPSMQVIKVKQNPAYTFDELIANFGGQLGLFLGASLLTIGEFIDYACRLCYYKVKTRKDKTKITSENKTSLE